MVSISYPVLVLIGSLMWIDVPFVRQETRGCGAASISMVMQYWQTKGHSVEPAVADAVKIMKLLFSKSEDGIRADQLVRYFNENGFKSFPFSGSVKDLAHHVGRGRPLIVALQAEGSSDKLHYMVVAGIDSQKELIIVNDPAEKKLLRVKQTQFEKRWNASSRWTLLAVPQQ